MRLPNCLTALALLAVVPMSALAQAPAPQAAPQLIRAAVLRVDTPELPPISRLELPPEDQVPEPQGPGTRSAILPERSWRTCSS